MWLELQTVSSLERYPLLRVSFIERFHCKVLTNILHYYVCICILEYAFLVTKCEWYSLYVYCFYITSWSDILDVGIYCNEQHSVLALQQ